MDLDLLKIDIVDQKQFALFRVNKDCNLWPYILFDATDEEKGNPSNLLRHSFIFPSQNVSKGDFVVIFTGVGDNTSYKNKSGTTTWSYYWGLEDILWKKKGDEALLVKLAEYKRYIYRE